MAASSEPERCAFQIGDERMSTEELRRRSVGAGYAVKALGAEHLAFVGSNSIAFPVAIFAAAAANVPFLPLNYRLSEAPPRRPPSIAPRGSASYILWNGPSSLKTRR